MHIAGHHIDTWRRAFPHVPRAPHTLRRASSRRRPETSGDVGVLERRNPVPPGRYWVDVFEKDQSAFAAWLHANQAAVRVRSNESFPANDGGPSRVWYLFEVLSPVRWDGPGFPEVAPSNVNTSSDTVDRPPPPPSAADQIGSALQGAKDAVSTGKTALIVGAGVAALVAVALISKG